MNQRTNSTTNKLTNEFNEIISTTNKTNFKYQLQRPITTNFNYQPTTTNFNEIDDKTRYVTTLIKSMAKNLDTQNHGCDHDHG